MDIEQFFSDINLHNKESTKPYALGRHGSQLHNNYIQGKYTGRIGQREISGLYSKLKMTFERDTLKLPQTETDLIIPRFMNSSRVIRFPKIYQNERELHIHAKRKRLNSVLANNKGDTTQLSKEEVFIMERSPSKSHMNGVMHQAQEDLGNVINRHLKGRSQSTSKVVIIEKRSKINGEYGSLSKQYPSKLLFRQPIIKQIEEFQRRFSIPENKIYFDQTIDVYGSRLHAQKLSEDGGQQELPQVSVYHINPRSTRRRFDNDPANINIQPLGGRTIAVLPSPTHLTPQKSLPHSKQVADTMQKKHRPSRKPTIKDLKMEYHPLLQSDFTRLILAYNFLQIKENRQGMYKAYIGHGNNSVLVKKALKARGYWIIAQSHDEDVNFLWTQTRNIKFLQQLQPRTLQTIKSDQILTKKYSPLVEPFIKEKLNQHIFTELIGSILTKEMLPKYVDNIIHSYIRHPKHPIDASKISEFVNSDRQQKFSVQTIENPHSQKLHNHVDSASSIGNKKGLLFFMKRYYTLLRQDPFQVIPETVHLKQRQVTEKMLKQIVNFGLPCILKPGESTNRGKGITVHTSWSSLIGNINRNSKHENGQERTHIIQRYVMPFLYNNRKFDIRVWVLWSGRQAWWYKQGYIRTSSKEFNIKSCNKYVHLTNDAIQKHSEDYGRYEPGNKISFNEFQKYLDHTTHGRLSFWDMAYPQMKKIAHDVFRVGHHTMDTQQKMFGYELFGLDFMIDDNFKVWLIQANTNPCLETSCSILTRLITNMIDNVISVAVDPLFPPPSSWKKRSSTWSMETFKFQLIYDGNAENQKLQMEEQVKFETEEDEFEEKEELPQK